MSLTRHFKFEKRLKKKKLKQKKIFNNLEHKKKFIRYKKYRYIKIQNEYKF